MMPMGVADVMNRQAMRPPQMVPRKLMVRRKVRPDWRRYRGFGVLQFGEVLILVLMNLQRREKFGVVVLRSEAEP